MGKPSILTRDPAMPAYTVAEATNLCESWGLPVSSNTLKTAIRRGQLRRHLISNRIRLSENDIRDWIASTADAAMTPRHIPGRAS